MWKLASFIFCNARCWFTMTRHEHSEHSRWLMQALLAVSAVNIHGVYCAKSNHISTSYRSLLLIINRYKRLVTIHMCVHVLNQSKADNRLDFLDQIYTCNSRVGHCGSWNRQKAHDTDIHCMCHLFASKLSMITGSVLRSVIQINGKRWRVKGAWRKVMRRYYVHPNSPRSQFLA